MMKGDDVDIYIPDITTSQELSFADEGVHAGFPSPAQDYIEKTLDLNRLLIPHPESTFYARVVGDSMVDLDITEGDILVVDKSLKPADGDMVICYIQGDFALKTVEFRPDRLILHPANSCYKVIEVLPEESFCIWGVVTWTIKSRLNALSSKAKQKQS